MLPEETRQDGGNASRYEGFVDMMAGRSVIGWARCLDTDSPVTIKVYNGSHLVTTGMADMHRGDLERAGKGSGRHGFNIAVPPGLPLDQLRVEIDGVGSIPFSFALRSALGVDAPALSSPPAVPTSPAPVTYSGPAGSAVAPGEPALWLDLSDFLYYLRHHKTVSGIQRVQCEIVRVLLAGAPMPVRFCITTYAASGYVELPASVMRGLLDRLDSNASIPEAEWVSYVVMISDTDRLRPAMITTGSMLFVLGAFWCLPDAMSLLASLRSQGVHIGVYVYDLIPLNSPEFCDNGVIRTFVSTFALMAQIADLTLTISQFTAQEVIEYYKSIGQAPKDVRPLLLAHEMCPNKAQGQGGNFAPLLERIDGPFVLCVCTIEVRKNHLYLLRIWRELLKKHPRASVPKLVLVGRRGWRVDDFFGQLESSRYLEGHVKILHDLDNFELEALYQHSLFTVFPSLSEGWGLPVGESLTFGKLCIASNATSIPEVGHDFCVYVDPYNVSDGYQVIERYIFDSRLRDEKETAIRTRFIPRTWTEVTHNFLKEIRSYYERAGSSALQPMVRLPLGELAEIRRGGPVYSVADILREKPAFQLVCTQGWYPPEDILVWGKGTTSVLDFMIDTANQSRPARVRAFLLLVLPPWASNVVITLSSPCGASRQVATGNRQRHLVSLELAPQLTPQGESKVTLTLQLDREIPSPQEETRTLGVGLEALVAVDSADIGQRLDAMESLLAFSLSL